MLCCYDQVSLIYPNWSVLGDFYSMPVAAGRLELQSIIKCGIKLNVWLHTWRAGSTQHPPSPKLPSGRPTSKQTIKLYTLLNLFIYKLNYYFYNYFVGFSNSHEVKIIRVPCLPILLDRVFDNRIAGNYVGTQLHFHFRFITLYQATYKYNQTTLDYWLMALWLQVMKLYGFF